MKLYDIAPDEFRLETDRPAQKRGRVVVDVDNIADYFRATFHEGDHGWLTEKDVPNAVSPWPSVWVEYSMKRAYGLKEPGQPKVRFAFLLDQERVESGWTAKALQVSHYDDPRFASVFNTGTQWIANAYHRWEVDEDGKVTSYAFKEGKQYGSLLAREGFTKSDDVSMQLVRDLYPLWLAFSFANCRNVSAVNHETPAKVAAKRLKAGKPVGVTYKTLVIDGMKEVLRTEGGVERNGLKKALHICRGHFATYTEDAPLFGKVTGTFWKPMHTRGSKKRGEVKKDYKVIAGE